MGRRLAGWRRLNWGDRGRLLACMLALPMIHASLALLGYQRTRRGIEALTRFFDTHEASETEIADARQLAHLATIAGVQTHIDAACLRRSLLLLGWLRRRGLKPALHFGAKKQDDQLLAHAWIELEGLRLREADADYPDAFDRQ